MSEIGPGPGGQSTENSQPESASPAPSGADSKETNMWAMFLHFSILCGWVVPLAGLIVPIIEIFR